MAEVIFCDPIKDLEVRKLFRSLSPKKIRSISPENFEKKVYPKFASFLKRKEKKLNDRLKANERKMNESLEKLNYSKMYSKNVECKTQIPFLERSQAEIVKRQKKYIKNSLERKKKDEISVIECSFHPKIKKFGLVSSRSIKDLYKWDKIKEEKRKNKKKIDLEEEMKTCISKWRSPLKRSRLNKSVHLKER